MHMNGQVNGYVLLLIAVISTINPTGADALGAIILNKITCSLISAMYLNMCNLTCTVYFFTNNVVVYVFGNKRRPYIVE